jgi:hypothetical protein
MTAVIPPRFTYLNGYDGEGGVRRGREEEKEKGIPRKNDSSLFLSLPLSISLYLWCGCVLL